MEEQKKNIENKEVSKSIFFLQNIVTKYCNKCFGWKHVGEVTHTDTVSWTETHKENITTPTSYYDHNLQRRVNDSAYSKTTIQWDEQKTNTTVTKNYQFQRLLPYHNSKSPIPILEGFHSLCDFIRTLSFFVLFASFFITLIAFIIEGQIIHDEAEQVVTPILLKILTISAIIYIISTVCDVILAKVAKIFVDKFRKEQLQAYENRFSRLREDFKKGFVDSQTYQQLHNNIMIEYNLIK